MATEYNALVMKETDGAISFVYTTISGSKMPSVINGESGHHICYVKTLTELLAKQLVQLTDQYDLDEKKISQIALASSLHDIGKCRIPQAILDKKGSLTPIEYDIVKKHTVFGWELIEESGDALDPEIKAYARDVCLHHHERFDGTGYPDGLKGDDIPIWAQVVSIADAYEAITSERSYKSALSRDVALEMITNGMCGVFNPLLIQCLIQVADRKELEDIRSNLITSRAVHIDPYSLPPKKVLLLGNMRYITQQFIENSFPDAHISIIGKCAVKPSRNVKIYDIDKPYYKAILDTYDFDFIIYFANELTYDTTDPSDTEELRQILKASKYVSSEAKFLYLSSLDAAFDGTSDRGIVASAKEDICLYWARQNHVNLKIVRIPYLYNGAAKNDFLYNLFDEMRAQKSIRLRESDSSEIHFLSLQDLSDLIVRIADAWTPGEGILTVNDDFHITFGDLCNELARLCPGVTFDFTGKNPPKCLNLKNTALKQQYSWFARISLLTDLEDEYQAYRDTLVPTGTWWEKLKKRLEKYTTLIKIAELLVLFILCEILVQVTHSALFFSIVDFRLAYIVIIATLYGLPYGMGAATLCSLSWIAAKVLSGTNWLTLFYEPTNWLTFIFYFLVGGICGYVKLKKENQIKFTTEENHLLESKLAFTRRIYEDTFREKRDLKKQIIGSKDSFGKIFDITRQLNTVDSRELYLKIIDSFESILENKTLSVYSVSNGSTFARLEVSSRDIMHDVSRSISLDTYAPVMEVLNRGEVWRNNHFMPHMPMFACGIYKDNKPLLLIFVWNAQTHQRSLYYVNLLRILCDLTQMSFIRAHEYSRAMHDQQYIGYTILQNAQTFRNTLHVFRELEERRVFQFLQLAVDDTARSQEELSAVLSKCVRTNDIAGLLEDGSVWLLLSQAGPDDLKFILPRFERQGLSVRVAEIPSPEKLLVKTETAMSAGAEDILSAKTEPSAPDEAKAALSADAGTAVPAWAETLLSANTETVPPAAAEAVSSAKAKAASSTAARPAPRAKTHTIFKINIGFPHIRRSFGERPQKSVEDTPSQKRSINQ